MKRVLGLIGAVALIVTSIGCANRCNNCGPGAGCGPCGSGRGGCFAGNGGGHFGNGAGGGLHGNNLPPGPPTPTVAYPYYTTRGPRDFLSSNPRGIGP